MSLNDASAAMMCWIMSDRTIPRSLKHIPGFGVHTWALINAEVSVPGKNKSNRTRRLICSPSRISGTQGKRSFVKFHWVPQAGTHSLVWDEALKLAGQDPDFHRRDLYESIDVSQY